MPSQQTPEHARLMAETLVASAMVSTREWTEALRLVAKPLIEKLVAAGALDELATRHIAKSKSAESWLDDHSIIIAAGLSAMQVPAELMEMIRAAVEELLNQPHWLEFATEVRAEIRAAIEQGIAGGQTIKQIRVALEKTSAKLSKARALRIARTEVNASLAYGHYAMAQQLADDVGGVDAPGALGASEWVSQLDDKVRPSHAAADGQIRKLGEMFDIGGFPARFPGNPNLPVGERINCRCMLYAAATHEAENAPQLVAVGDAG